MRFGLKTIMCLRIAQARHDDRDEATATAIYERACAEFSEKAILRKFQELVDRDYMECGVTARSGWLTEKGRRALQAVEREAEG